MPFIATVKYNIVPKGHVRPYIGFGAHYTQVSRTFPDRVVGISHSSTGWVGQVGVDFRISDGWFVNADARYLADLEPFDVIGGSHFLRYKIDPFLLGIGIHFRFGGSETAP